MISESKDLKLAIIGLGYVGLPLALEFSKKREVIGFDIQEKRIKDLQSGVDKNLEVTKNELKNAKQLTLTNDIKKIVNSNCYIVAVPTPIDSK
jgi:UDP-N-acetyl-D-galactosamine dehydrogenase